MGISSPVSAALVRDWAHHALVALGAAREEIDSLNVFPVPDGDTGTNLYLTVEAAAASVDACCGDGEPSADEAARALAMGALLGARGNSGVILSQILRGFGEILSEISGAALDGAGVHRLLARGSERAYEAVAQPVEGTILTVIREAAEGAAEAVRGGRADAASVLEHAVQTAEEALERTPTMLESLRLAGVVDAGGQGLVMVLAALAQTVSGVPRPMPRVRSGPVGSGEEPTVARALEDYAGPAYEVMYLLEATQEGVAALRDELGLLGDSLVVVGGDGLWNVHVHVDDAGAAVEAALAVGRPTRIRITYLQHDNALGREVRRLVAVTHGPGIAALLGDAGVVVVPAQPRARPATAEFLDAMEQSHATEIVLLPSDRDTTAVAEIAAEEGRRRGRRVAVIPTRSVVQTLAAVAMHDSDQPFDDDVVAMTRAAGATRYAAATIASRSALTTVGPCAEGDVLGLVDGDIAVIGTEVLSVCQEMLSGMLAIGGELVTLLFGSDADDDLRGDLVEWLTRSYPMVEVVEHDAGQPLWPVIVGVE